MSVDHMAYLPANMDLLKSWFFNKLINVAPQLHSQESSRCEIIAMRSPANHLKMTKSDTSSLLLLHNIGFLEDRFRKTTTSSHCNRYVCL